ncbi:hypothetical protein EG329_001629 [Mollisiaceae sp. DMI_Dod_QoI]|nr:hypothetical protein EG329_001629 [Helotiales sp. DMI_Dod_QoI]
MEEASSSSKVTVEYFDPYGVYQLLSPGLLPRLPLRNLHWESHAGPLRSISTLHIDLKPSTQNVRPLFVADAATASTSSLSRVKSEDSAASGDDGFRTQALGQPAGERPESRSGPIKPVKERRHQIPGLRQTPYLKVFFLRCDDNDTYKNQARRQVREWIKDHTPPAQSTTKITSQENHDAYEWLIVHVIVPNTAAATQPRTSGKSSESSSGSISEKSGPRWRGGGSSTILEKLRADFNGTSKSAIDRVAQIRIGINDVPYDMLPRVVPAIPGTYTETPQENENAWLDLISKLKSLILASFDSRVSQYEEDIREKDAQRSLPGWNFCTFFVLKEGLARGFESVGLVEDALVGYDELAVGLDTIIREQSSTGSSVARGGSFLPYTEDLKKQTEKARAAMLRDMGAADVVEYEEPIDLQSTTRVLELDDNEIPLNASKKRYRELILANDISIFDFRCYLFARQLSLLLRLANAWSSQEELLAKLKEQRESSLQGVAARLPASQPADDAEVLTVLGEICRRSMYFVASISRIMREDIWASCKASSNVAEEQDATSISIDPVMTQVVDNIVSSFTFAFAQQILAQTSTKSLPIPPSTLAPPSSKIGLDGQEPKAAIPEPKTMMHPARSSSLALRSSSREPPSPGRFPGARRSSVPEQGATPSPFLKAGLEQLAARRAELYVLSRNVLERVGKERGWSAGWAEVAHLQSDDGGKMEEVDLNEDATIGTNKSSTLSTIPPSSHGIENKLLQTAIDNKDDFYRLYETLTDKALRHFTVANHIQSVQSSMADLAILKYHLKDYAAAASYFYRMTPFYGDGGWAQVELSMLIMYATCLRELQRKEEYVKVVLKLLSKSAMIEKERILRKSTLQIGHNSNLSPEVLTTESYLSDLLEITKTLPHEIHVPLQNFFGHIEVDSTVRYHPEMDSFGLQLRLQYLLSDDITIEKAKVKIVPLAGETNREIWLEMEGHTVFRKGTARLSVKSNTIVPGTYIATHLILQSNNITLQYDHNSTNVLNTKGGTFFRCPKLLIYHRAEAFDVRLFASRYLHLDRNRSLEIELSPGWNNVTSGELHVRAATAGLRVQTSEAKLVYGTLEISKKPEAGIIRFGAVESNSSSKLVMPFNLEHEVNEISLKIEITYATEKGTFFFSTTPSVSIMLPLGVNVQDMFKHKALFSKFTISSSTSSPLRLLSSRLEGSEVFGAENGVPISKPLVVFPRQPASMLYKITKLKSQPKPQTGSRKGSKSSLSLVLNYTCIEEEIENAVTENFSQFLEKNSLDSYARLMVPIVLTELRAHLSPYDFERIAILNEVSTSLLSSVNWRSHFSGLGRNPESSKDTAILLEECLQNWLQQNSNLQLPPFSTDDESVRNSRSIVIPVDVPSVTLVHTADLKLLDPSPSNMIVAASNQPISASLNIKWTRIWDNEIGSENGIGPQSDYMEFFYEISGASDAWLIGGRRKGHFRVPRRPQEQDSKQKLSFPVVLIPLREGFLPFPNVDIKPAPSMKIGGHTDDEPPRVKQPIVTCETDFKNAGETLRVISDARKTTVSLDASGPQGGAWLLESERRSVGDGGIVLG